VFKTPRLVLSYSSKRNTKQIDVKKPGSQE